jgi:RNA polymerase sigma-32 factor
VLHPRERHIFEARFLSEPSVRLEELATRYGISRERVRQIEMRAFEKVRAAVSARMAGRLACRPDQTRRGSDRQEPGGDPRRVIIKSCRCGIVPLLEGP